MKTLTRLALCAALTTAVSFAAVEPSIGASPPAPGWAKPVALGFAQLDPPTGNNVWISFAAFEDSDGTVFGSGVLRNYSTGVHIYFDLSSTTVVAGRTYLAGPVTATQGGGPPIGFTAFFAVEDNGYGWPPPDRISNFFAFPPQAGTTVYEILAGGGPIPEQFIYDLKLGGCKVF